MTTLPSALAAIRFGFGLRPGEAPPDGPQALMKQLRDARKEDGADAPGLAERMEMLAANTDARKMQREKMAGGELAVKNTGRLIAGTMTNDRRRMLARAIDAEDGFFERLAWFWTDHFSVEAANRRRALLTHDMIESAIRPQMTRRFSDLLIAVTKHPAMLTYLNQNRSTGPNSKVGQKGKRGLNENLAREILELHTLGVGADYAQTDVRQFAELLTGLTLDDDGYAFNPRLAEPGAETLLGESYGGKRASEEDIDRALTDLAMHPETARHLSRKLYVHFIGGAVDEDAVEALAKAYLEEDGKLMPLYRTLVNLPQAMELPLQKAKTPLEFTVSALRALDVSGPEVLRLSRKQFSDALMIPLMQMGQPLLEPTGPDGFPEEPEAWITPAGLAARVSWAGALAQERARDMDPRAFVETALGPVASDLLVRAVAGSETKHEGVALVLASPEFNRR
ncbi:DUF1800 domain-containing protein [Halovulum sp. GXIMD14794]